MKRSQWKTEDVLSSISIQRSAAQEDRRRLEELSFSAMAINTDAAFEKSALGDREVSNPTDFHDTEKLLSTGANEPTGQSNIKPSDSFSLAIRGSVRSLDADQNGHRSPLKSGSMGQLGTPPKSSSRLSLGPVPSPVPRGSAPSTYLWLAVVSCFCPAVPLNICALWYAHVVSCVYLQPHTTNAVYIRMTLCLCVSASLLLLKSQEIPQWFCCIECIQ